MSRWVNRVQHALQAGRPPTPSMTAPATTAPVGRVAVVGPQETLRSWLPQALELEPGPSVLVIDSRPASRPPRSFIETVAGVVSDRSTTSAADDRWARITGLDGAWLRWVDVPASIAAARNVVTVTAPGGPAGVARLWLDVVHPNTAIRARPLPRAGAVELAVWLPARWVLRLAVGVEPLVAVTASAVMAELLALGLARMAESSVGIEAITPWEDVGVQRLFELQLQTGDAGTTIRPVDAATACSPALAAIAETIGATIAAAEKGCGE